MSESNIFKRLQAELEETRRLRKYARDKEHELLQLRESFGRLFDERAAEMICGVCKMVYPMSMYSVDAGCPWCSLKAEVERMREALEEIEKRTRPQGDLADYGVNLIAAEALEPTPRNPRQGDDDE